MTVTNPCQMGGSAATDEVLHMPNYDLTYRPPTYWPDTPSVSQLVASITGEARRAIVTDHPELSVDAGNWILKPTLTPEERSWWGSLHPSFMGGEYLPALEAGEVEIARISVASTSADQICIRARRLDDGIGYRVVDDYDTPYACERRSAEPLTLAELIALLDDTDHPDEQFSGGGLVRAHWQHIAEYAEPRDRIGAVTGFVRLSSPFYAGLSAYYEDALVEWLAAWPEEDDAGTEDDAPDTEQRRVTIASSPRSTPMRVNRHVSLRLYRLLPRALRVRLHLALWKAEYRRRCRITPPVRVSPPGWPTPNHLAIHARHQAATQEKTRWTSWPFR